MNIVHLYHDKKEILEVLFISVKEDNVRVVSSSKPITERSTMITVFIKYDNYFRLLGKTNYNQIIVKEVNNLCMLECTIDEEEIQRNKVFKSLDIFIKEFNMSIKISKE